MEEVWKPVVGYKGIYEVSNHGQVRSVRKNTCTQVGRIIKPTISRYARVALYKEGHRSFASIHRLVAEAFIGPCPPGYITNHRNGNRLDNRPENLEWVTSSENSMHSVNILGNEPPKGEGHGMSKLTEKQVLEIRQLYKAGGHSQNKLARLFGVSQWHIYSIIHRKYWKHI